MRFTGICAVGDDSFGVLGSIDHFTPGQVGDFSYSLLQAPVITPGPATLTIAGGQSWRISIQSTVTGFAGRARLHREEVDRTGDEGHRPRPRTDASRGWPKTLPCLWCGELRRAHTGLTVRLSGWLHRKRDHGNVLFLDLRDHYGVIQCVVHGTSPLLKTADPTTTLANLLAARNPIYGEANLVVVSRDVPHEVIVEEIVTALRSRLGIAGACDREDQP